MKAILYAGAALMTGASIFGFVDYYKAKDNKEVTGLYSDKAPSLAPSVNEVKTESSAKEVTVPKIEEAKAVTKATAAAKVTDVKKEVVVKKKKKAKKVNAKMFSRGSLKEFTPPRQSQDLIKE